MEFICEGLFTIFYELLGNMEIVWSGWIEGSITQFYAMGLAIFFTCLIVWQPIRLCFRLVKWGFGD